MELADGGTLFLDEVGEIPVASQAKLLRCLQERTFKRVGGTRDIKVDVRVTAATNRSLEGMVRRHVPRGPVLSAQRHPVDDPPAPRPPRGHPAAGPALPLRGEQHVHKAVKRLAPETETLLLSYGWPGNVRELKNLIERLVILSTGDTIEARPAADAGHRRRRDSGAEEVSREPRTLAAVEKSYILKVLRQVNGNKSEAAKILGITRQTLRKKLTEEPLLSPDIFHPARTTWRMDYGRNHQTHPFLRALGEEKSCLSGVIDQSQVWYPLCSKAVARDSRGTRPA